MKSIHRSVRTCYRVILPPESRRIAVSLASLNAHLTGVRFLIFVAGHGMRHGFEIVKDVEVKLARFTWRQRNHAQHLLLTRRKRKRYITTFSNLLEVAQEQQNHAS